MITVKVSGIPEARSFVTKLTPEASRLAVLRMSQAAYDSAQAGAGAHNKTGALFRSLFNKAIPGGREVGHDLTAAPHAVFVHWGTRPHIIRPKTRKALRWSRGGAFHFARFVKHPGYAGDAWMLRAADDAVRQFATIIDRSIKDAAA